MTFKKGGPGRGHSTRTAFFPPLDVNDTKEIIREKLTKFVQTARPGDKIRIKGIPLGFFMLVGANKTQPTCPILVLGYLYKRSRIFIRSFHNFQTYKSNINHPDLPKFLEVFLEMYPQYAGLDDEANPTTQMTTYKNKGL